MSEAAEGNFYAADGTTPFPIQKKAFEEFFKYNESLSCFQKLVNQKRDCVLVGKGIAEMEGFQSKLYVNDVSAGGKNFLPAVREGEKRKLSHLDKGSRLWNSYNKHNM